MKLVIGEYLDDFLVLIGAVVLICGVARISVEVALIITGLLMVIGGCLIGISRREVMK